MATSYMLRPIHASSNFPCPPPPTSTLHADRPRSHVHHRRASNNRHNLSSLRCMRDCTRWLDFSSKLSFTSSSHSVLVLPYGKFAYRISAVFDAGTQVSTPVNTPSPVSFNGSNGGGNPSSSVNLDANAKPEFPPEDFDYEIYASMTMDCFVPPPPPRIPFGGPFEDYYDVIVGEDYIPKQEKPTSSFLMFLESLNKKRRDETDETKKPKDMPMLFNRNEPLIPKTRSTNANARNAVFETPPVPQTRGPQASSDGVGETSATGQPLSPQTRPVEPSVRLSRAIGSFSDSGRSLSPQLRSDENISRPVSTDSSDNRILTPATRSSGEFPSPSDMFSSPASSSDTGRVSSPGPSSTSDRLSSPAPSSYLDSRDQLASRTSSSELFPQTRSHDQRSSTYSSQSVPTAPSSGPQYFDRALTPATRPAPQNTLLGNTSSSTFTQENQDMSQASESSQPTQPYTGRLSRPVSPDNAVLLSLQASGESLAVPLNMDGSTPTTRLVMKDSDDPLSRPVSTESNVPLSDPVEQVQDSRGSSQARPMEETSAKEAINSNLVVPSEVQTQAPGVSTRSLYPQFRQTAGAQKEQVDEINGSSAVYPQSLPVAARVLNQTRQAPTSVNDVLETTQLSQFYEPTVGDMVVGAVVYADNQQLELEIGAELPALMALKDFELYPQIVDNLFYKLPSDGIIPASGQSFIVDDRAAHDSSYQETVEIGTVVLAEVQGRAVIDGRAILRSRQPAERLAWLRVGQLMQKGEVVQLEIVQWNEGGLLGYLEGIRAFLPRSELLLRPESSAALRNYVGQTLSVAVVEADQKASNCIISEARVWKSKNLLLGSVHDLTVTRVYGYGLQVEIDNTRIRGFLHISNISKEYVSAVGNYFTEGDKVKGMLIRGRNPDQVSFSTAELETEKGQMLRDKQRVYEQADEVAKSALEGLSLEERELFKLSGSMTNVDFQDVMAANLKWLDKATGLKSL